MLNAKIPPPRTWGRSRAHLVTLLMDPYYRALVQVQDCLHHATNDFFRNHDLRSIDLPLTTESISSPTAPGSDSFPIEIEFLGQRIFLADSMQFMLELGCRLHPRGAYYKSLSFRGEESDDTHLNQFHHVECEIPGTLEDAMSLAADLIQHLTNALVRLCADQVYALAGSIAHLERLVVSQGEWPRVPFPQAVTELKRVGDGFVHRHPHGFDVITRKGEAALLQTIGNGLALWLTGFPASAVPFYQARDPQDPFTTLSADLLLGTCEVLGSGQRHVQAADVERSLVEQHVPRVSYDWYLEMRNVKPIQTAGFGLGLERYLMWALQQSDIRDCTLMCGRLGASELP